MLSVYGLKFYSYTKKYRLGKVSELSICDIGIKFDQYVIPFREIASFQITSNLISIRTLISYPEFGGAIFDFKPDKWFFQPSYVSKIVINGNDILINQSERIEMLTAFFIQNSRLYSKKSID